MYESSCSLFLRTNTGIQSGPDAFLRPKKNNTLVSRKVGDEKNFHPGGCKKKFFINLIEFFKKSLHFFGLVNIFNISQEKYFSWKYFNILNLEPFQTNMPPCDKIRERKLVMRAFHVLFFQNVGG